MPYRGNDLFYRESLNIAETDLFRFRHQEAGDDGDEDRRKEDGDVDRQVDPLDGRLRTKEDRHRDPNTEPPKRREEQIVQGGVPRQRCFWPVHRPYF